MIRALAVCLALAVTPLSAQTSLSLADLQTAAAEGDAQSQFLLAEVYRRGEGVPQNYARAADWYAQAAEQGHAAALNALAGLYAGGLGVPSDPARAYELVAQAADSGEAEYIHNLAAVVEAGIGTDADPARAAELYAEAAALGWADSAVALGVLYQDGRGVEQDVARAMKLYTGPAEAGHPRAQNNLGLILSRGEGGVAQDYAAAAEWFRSAAEAGLPEAIRNLGVMYENGFGVPLDEAEAQRLYRLAALAPGQSADAQGDASGLTLLYDDRLMPPDANRLAEYSAAARAGDPVAEFLLGYLRASAAQSGADFREAVRLFESAANKGSAAAMANLGILMFEGRGVLQDYVAGYKWLSLAATAGLPGAAAARDELARLLTPDQINAANAAAEQAWSARVPD
ncbi:tetratricopeptide repeat protein [Psychromarinibacter sp. S121]|uniref:tetratricopeptide repeat protein n=1 Tax=Psychromarinibacter sp. S121 TaxID=3415127 RepID=UPI003C7A3096